MKQATDSFPIVSGGVFFLFYFSQWVMFNVTNQLTTNASET